MLEPAVAEVEAMVDLDGLQSSESVDVAEAARVDAALGAVHRLDARLGREADEGVVVGVPGGAVDDFAGSAASQQPLGAEPIRTHFFQTLRVHLEGMHGGEDLANWVIFTLRLATRTNVSFFLRELCLEH